MEVRETRDLGCCFEIASGNFCKMESFGCRFLLFSTGECKGGEYRREFLGNTTCKPHNRNLRQIITVTSNAAVVDAESWGE